jgi:Protein of unknown function (DUF3175)
VEGPSAKSTPFGVPEFRIRRQEPPAFMPVDVKSMRFFAMAQPRKSAALRRPAGRKRQTARKSARKAAGTRPSSKRWSQRVTQGSDALDLKRGVFTLRDPKRIAASLKRSAERSTRRKAGAYRSALSMLTFYINRAGKTLPKAQRSRLNQAKVELKRQFGRG